MRIATLQFAPCLGDVRGNIRRAEELLKLSTTWSKATSNPSTTSDGIHGQRRARGATGIEELRPEILVLPELAFTGKIEFSLVGCHTLLSASAHRSIRGLNAYLQFSALYSCSSYDFISIAYFLHHRKLVGSISFVAM
jgi:hypothetical protein